LEPARISLHHRRNSERERKEVSQQEKLLLHIEHYFNDIQSQCRIKSDQQTFSFVLHGLSATLCVLVKTWKFFVEKKKQPAKRVWK
jgi:hypothetical protein